MVASADGAVTLSGRSGGLSGPADKMLFKVLRSLADVIVVGAGTARAEHYRPVQPDGVWTGLRMPAAPLPAIAVVSASLDFADCPRLLSVPPGPSQTIVITSAAAPADRKAALAGQVRIIEAGDKRVDLRSAVAALRDLGYASILTEGGPMLLGELGADGLLDELCLTTSPLLAGGSAGRIVAGSSGPDGGPWPARLSLAHVLADGDALLSRYLVSHVSEHQPS
ncbi:MAG: dihydrofolate reductase family protein [Actinobacteria bacterium]|nr:dihydrofolate reductase family protein [Actinomycetota bacterium]